MISKKCSWWFKSSKVSIKAEYIQLHCLSIMTSVNNNTKVWLNEVSFMRPFLLFLLVSYHAFAPWCGAWGLPVGCHDYESYRWVALFSRAFRLEAFVFVSGYIFTFQMLEKNKFTSFGQFLKSKIVRLLIPCWVFGILYFILFKKYVNIWQTIYNIGGGIGHLWYLPCLFICFIAQYFLLELKTNTKITLVILICLVFLSFVPLPLHLNQPLYFILFFYGGGLFYQNKDSVALRANTKSILLCWTIFAALLVIINLWFIQSEKFANPTLLKIAVLGSNKILKSILAWSGITALYLTAVQYCRTYKISDFILKIGVCGYGVYVFHQFVLVRMYDKTPLPEILGTYWLPWVGLAVATVVSVLLTLAVRSTKLGRKFL